MPTTSGKIYLGSVLVAGGGGGGEPPAPAGWVRNPSWPACEADAGDNKIVGLYAVWPGDGVGTGGNFFAMTISGAYTINFGDGTTTNFTSGSTAYREFDYNNANLANTDAPVTFTASTDTVNRTAHGYSNGMIVRFYNIVTTTGLEQGQQYYVINATANTFQVSLTEGGSAVVLTNDGSATLLPYKIATVTITPQAANDLTSVNFFVKHNQASLANGYATGWLDIAIAAPSCTALTIGSISTTIRHDYLEQVRLNQLGSITTFANLFARCRVLQSVVIADTITTVTNTSNMFSSCSSLTSVPLFDTSSVTTMSGMLQLCGSLTSVPSFNTPLLTNTIAMFANCDSLRSASLFDTSSVTRMDSMFQACYSLTSVPLFDTSLLTNTTNMFRDCYALTSVPLFDTSSVTTMISMFRDCFSLHTVPALVTTAVTSSSNFTNMFVNCNSNARIEAKDFRFTFSVASNKLSAAALDEIYTNLPVVVGQTITVSGNYGRVGDDPTIATLKGWTVTGS
jgi:surface protein